jgi:hypothetical protein
MSKIVLGVGTSHTPMLNAPVTDWLKFIERDIVRDHLDRQGNPVTYEQLKALAPDDIAGHLKPEVLAAKHEKALMEVARLSKTLKNAKLDALIVVGDDQKELYDDSNMPAVLVYRGDAIRNVPLSGYEGSEWNRDALAKYYETDKPRDYPVNSAFAHHLINHLVESHFDISCADSLKDGYGEGHAFGFVHNRLLTGTVIPVVPVFLNTYYPPNQPTPERCYLLGQAIRQAVESFAGDLRFGIIASGGLSHFTVDEDFDAEVIAALKSKDAKALAALPRALLNSGNSEIRNWICVAGGTEHLNMQHLEYIPAYRTPAGTGTGLCFAEWW